MKKIIEGKIYNTKTATMVCDTGNNLSVSDFGYERSGLYMTKKGAFFCAGRGGAMSSYTSYANGQTSGSSGCYPVTIEDALTIAERHASSEVIEKFFSDMIEEA
tara:strand:- start:324 stop:635 length:312 start_codon:yes stop_codon:yes gene_type:complete